MTNTGRFTLSPTGDFHLGNLRTAILVWAWTRTTGRRLVLRIESIDRERTGSAEHQIRDLVAIGVNWDGESLIQTERADTHEAALASLGARGLVFKCYCTRHDIREATSAPHIPPGHYPGTCLTLNEAERSSKRAALTTVGHAPTLRLVVPSPERTVFGGLHDSYTGAVDHFVAHRADGVPAYNLAAVIDDAFQGIGQAVCGFGLLSQAPARAQLTHLLGVPEPTYAHVPLALAPSGTRLVKRDGAVTLSDLRGLGWSTEDVVSFIGISLGMPGVHCASDIADALGISGSRSLPTESWITTPSSS